MIPKCFHIRKNNASQLRKPTNQSPLVQESNAFGNRINTRTMDRVIDTKNCIVCSKFIWPCVRCYMRAYILYTVLCYIILYIILLYVINLDVKIFLYFSNCNADSCNDRWEPKTTIRNFPCNSTFRYRSHASFDISCGKPNLPTSFTSKLPVSRGHRIHAVPKSDSKHIKHIRSI